MVKLVNHRTVSFRHRFTSKAGDRIGWSGFGPQGSSACYLVTRKAAERLLQGMARQSLPLGQRARTVLDHGVEVYTVEKDLVDFGHLRDETLIASRADYRQLNLHGLKKVPTHLFRISEAVRRALHTIMQ